MDFGAVELVLDCLMAFLLLWALVSYIRNRWQVSIGLLGSMERMDLPSSVQLFSGSLVPAAALLALFISLVSLVAIHASGSDAQIGALAISWVMFIVASVLLALSYVVPRMYLMEHDPSYVRSRMRTLHTIRLFPNGPEDPASFRRLAVATRRHVYVLEVPRGAAPMGGEAFASEAYLLVPCARCRTAMRLNIGAQELYCGRCGWWPKLKETDRRW